MKLLKLNKDKKKIIRGTLEAFILLVILIIIIRALFVFSEYKPYDTGDKAVVSGEDKGFIAISYLAVDREGSSTMISTKRLEEHLKALYDNGYVTITQEDIKNYYLKGKPLPDKALFLMFEDGRRDTAIFAQKIMEKYNFLGTMLSYADKFGKSDSKFLKPKDLLNLVESSYWELGTNGYRLSYINVFDRYDNYLGELTSDEYSVLHKYLGRNYNQYLMDYIRDENQIPKENYTQMKDRISKDYSLMEEIYGKELGEIPEVYVLMHSNTGSYANNEKVSDINKEWMNRLFAMNFNREGYSLNNKESEIYDLTRMQPQAYWYTNHLLMRIADDTGADITFADGDLTKKEKWETLSGAAEFKDSEIALTSLSEGKGLLRLKNSENYADINVSLSMTGNKLGSQAVYLRADENLKTYICVKIQNNYLKIEENGKELVSLDLNEFDGIDFQSIKENEQEALDAEYDTYKKGTEPFNIKTSMEEQKIPSEEDVKFIEDGAESYIPAIQINEAGNRKVAISLIGNKITVSIDGKKAAEDLTVKDTQAGSVYVESAWGEYGYSQRNIADDVYDGVFKDLYITGVNLNDTKTNNWDTNQILYDNRLHGFEKIKSKVKSSWSHVLNWFIKTL